MNTPSNPRLISSMKSFSRAASITIILIGSLVLLGWMLNIPVLKSILPGIASMKANTASAFILAGLALWLIFRESATRLERYVAQVCALIIALVGLLTLSEYMFGWQLGIDQLLFKELPGNAGTFAPGRMSPTTALSFLLLGAALLLLDRRTAVGDRIAQLFGVLIALLSGLALLGYIYETTALYGVGTYNQIAIHTALTFIIVSAGLLCMRPDHGPMTIITSGNTGSMMARRLLPPTIVFPVILGWLRLKGQQAGLYDAQLGVALMVSSSIVVFISIIWLTARLLNQADVELKHAQAIDVRQSEERLRYVSWATRDAIWDRNMVSGAVWWNEGLQKLFNYRLDEVEPTVDWWEARIHPEDKAKVLRSIQNAIDTKQGFWSKEYRFQCADGSYADVFDCGYILQDEVTGQAQRMIGAMSDITERKRIENALRESEELFAKAFSASPAGITLTRLADGLDIEVNDAYLKLVEYCRSEVINHTILELGIIRAEDLARLRQMLEDQDGIRNFEIQLRTKSGRLKTVIGALEWVEVGNETCILSIFYDITERKQTEEKFAGLLESAPDALVIVDGQGQIRIVNSQTEKLFGYKRDELYGQTVEMLIPQRFRDRHPANRTDYFLDPTTRPMGAGMELYGLRKDGVEFPIDISLSPLNTGKETFATAAIRDITERKKIEQALAQEEYLLNTLLENAPDHIYFKDIESRFIRISKAHARLFGLSDPAQVIGKTDFDFFSEEHAGQAYDDEQEIIRTGQPINKEEKETWPDRPDTWVIATKMPLRNQNGEIVGTFGISKDITSRKRAEERLSETNENLIQGVRQLDQRNREIVLLNELSNMLQSCQSPDEAYTVISDSVQRLFPGACGALYTMNSSHTLMETAATWQTWQTLSPKEEHTFAPDDCLALRRGRSYFSNAQHPGLRCKHVVDSNTSYLCIPMIAQGEALGMFHLLRSYSEGDDASLKPAEQELAETVADSIALSLTNLKLRETLRSQSIRDPLTGLFNRRFMEESLERELGRAVRSQRPLGIIMLDLDYFKNFNDTFGHQAGDEVLRELGNFLRLHTRAGDIPCRYGGEEFLLVLPEAPPEIIWQRAEQLRDGIQNIQVQHQGISLGKITISIGVATFPKHGKLTEDLIRAADTALYRAKREGRNRVIVADSDLA
jgi:diguanylate cyclase (GGDEF)-like protein/PAS domain S-box-containing protein